MACLRGLLGGVAFTGHGVEDELIFDPNTATMLEERTISAARNPLRFTAGTIITSTTCIQRAVTDVNGHRFLPKYGHRFSPPAAMFSPHWWP